jgi:hypothetical protein
MAEIQALLLEIARRQLLKLKCLSGAIASLLNLPVASSQKDKVSLLNLRVAA